MEIRFISPVRVVKNVNVHAVTRNVLKILISLEVQENLIIERIKVKRKRKKLQKMTTHWQFSVAHRHAACTLLFSNKYTWEQQMKPCLIIYPIEPNS
jgi:hypothetical protein